MFITLAGFGSAWVIERPGKARSCTHSLSATKGCKEVELVHASTGWLLVATLGDFVPVIDTHGDLVPVHVVDCISWPIKPLRPRAHCGPLDLLGSFGGVKVFTAARLELACPSKNGPEGENSCS